MKLHSYTKKQLIASAVMLVIFFITVLYSKGYFDFTFVDRPNGTSTPSTQRQEQITPSSPENEETAYSEDYYGEQFGEQFEDYQDFFGDEDIPYLPEDEFEIFPDGQLGN